MSQQDRPPPGPRPGLHTPSPHTPPFHAAPHPAPPCPHLQRELIRGVRVRRGKRRLAMQQLEQQTPQRPKVYRLAVAPLENDLLGTRGRAKVRLRVRLRARVRVWGGSWGWGCGEEPCSLLTTYCRRLATCSTSYYFAMVRAAHLRCHVGRRAAERERAEANRLGEPKV